MRLIASILAGSILGVLLVAGFWHAAALFAGGVALGATMKG